MLDFYIWSNYHNWVCHIKKSQQNVVGCFLFIQDGHLACLIPIKHGTTAAKSLTAELVNRVWLLESLLNSSLEPPTSQHEEQDEAQLQGKGQHAQRYDGAVACWGGGTENRQTDLHCTPFSVFLGNTSDMLLRQLCPNNLSMRTLSSSQRKAWLSVLIRPKAVLWR